MKTDLRDAEASPKKPKQKSKTMKYDDEQEPSIARNERFRDEFEPDLVKALGNPSAKVGSLVIGQALAIQGIFLGMLPDETLCMMMSLSTANGAYFTVALTEDHPVFALADSETDIITEQLVDLGLPRIQVQARLKEIL